MFYKKLIDLIVTSLSKLDLLIDRKQEEVYGSYYDAKQRCKHPARPMAANGEYNDPLALTAACLSKARRATDVICRLGGDEFGIAAPDTDTMQARLLAARIRATLHDGGVTASIGWAVSKTSGKDGPNVEELWRHADELMYQDKRTRR